MNQEEIIQGNRIIAEFMGWTTDIGSVSGKEYRFAFKYHSCWNWLMPVVEKIELVKGGKVFMNQAGCEILMFGGTISRHYASTKIEAVWLAVVDFIKWYNQNN